MSVAEADALTEGSAFTFTLTVDVFEHPFASVPVTVYVVADEGASVTVAPFSDPGIQSYDAAPLPVSVTEFPIQMSVAEAEALTDGSAFTTTATVEVFEHPFISVPVTVYVVDEAGASVTVDPLSDPGIQS